MNIRTEQSGKEYSALEHYSYLVSSNGKNIYISGDADFTSRYQINMLQSKNIKIKIAFFNPLYLLHQSGRYLINRNRPRRVVMYHVPLQKNDKHNFRKMSQKAMDRFKESLHPSEILSEELQTFMP